jgi:hypothetical protein
MDDLSYGSPCCEVTLKYKRLWMVESLFRTIKSFLPTVPLSQA